MRLLMANLCLLLMILEKIKETRLTIYQGGITVFNSIMKGDEL